MWRFDCASPYEFLEKLVAKIGDMVPTVQLSFTLKSTARAQMCWSLSKSAKAVKVSFIVLLLFVVNGALN